MNGYTALGWWRGLEDLNPQTNYLKVWNVSRRKIQSNFILQGKNIYRAKHNRTGEEGLIFASNMREREALRVDPSLSLMP